MAQLLCTHYSTVFDIDMYVDHKTHNNMSLICHGNTNRVSQLLAYSLIPYLTCNGSFTAKIISIIGNSEDVLL